jgi:hypothetical protein
MAESHLAAPHPEDEFLKSGAALSQLMRLADRPQMLYAERRGKH